MIYATMLHFYCCDFLFNTLAQSWTTENTSEPIKQLIKGEGTNAGNKSAMLRRAKRKTIANKMILSLIDIAKEKGHYDRVQMYWNTYHCQRKIIKSGSTLHGNYCKNRFCTICLAIRKAENINKYHPVLKEWKESLRSLFHFQKFD